MNTIIISGHEEEMLALEEQDSSPVEIAAVRRIIADRVESIPAVGGEDLFGDRATAETVVRALRELAQAAESYAARIERQGCA